MSNKAKFYHEDKFLAVISTGVRFEKGDRTIIDGDIYETTSVEMHVTNLGNAHGAEAGVVQGVRVKKVS